MLIDNLKQPRTTQVQIHLDYDIYIHSIQGSFSLAQYFTHNWHNIWKIIDIECKTTIKMLQIIYLGYIYEKQACPTHFAVILHR